MSTSYRPLAEIIARDLFDGRLANYGVFEHVAADTGTTERRRILTDGRNYLLVYMSADGIVRELIRNGMNAPRNILGAVEVAFDTEIVSEYDGRYWGFESDEEYDKCIEEMAKEDNERFYADVLRYLKGQQPQELKRGTIGMQAAEQVRKMVAARPELLDSENEEELRALL
jgi:hypothetical protein